jgi:hypothetical protein
LATERWVGSALLAKEYSRNGSRRDLPGAYYAFVEISPSDHFLVAVN